MRYINNALAGKNPLTHFPYVHGSFRSSFVVMQPWHGDLYHRMGRFEYYNYILALIKVLQLIPTVKTKQVIQYTGKTLIYLGHIARLNPLPGYVLEEIISLLQSAQTPTASRILIVQILTYASSQGSHYILTSELITKILILVQSRWRLSRVKVRFNRFNYSS